MASIKGRPSMSNTVRRFQSIRTSTPPAHNGVEALRQCNVGDVRDDLDGGTEKIAAPLLLDDGLVNLAGGEVVLAGKRA